MALIVNFQKKLANFTLNVSFTADKNEGSLALLGPSGCGKSMTLKCIAGIERPDFGRIELDGRVLFDSELGVCVPAQERKVGYLFQNFALFPHMSVLENVACAVPREVAPTRAERRAEASHLLEKMQVEELSDQRPNTLSGGQQQRVAMARMLSVRPELLLFDEPTSALDSYLRWQVELELAELMRTSGVTCVLVSHNRDEVYRLCSQVCVLDQGLATQKQSMTELFSHPKTVAAARISGCKNIVAAHVVQDSYTTDQTGTSPAHLVRLCTAWGVELNCKRGAFGSLAPEAVTHLGVRAHYLKLCPLGAGGSSRQSPWRQNAHETEPYAKADCEAKHRARAEDRTQADNWVEVEIAQVIASPFSELVMLKMPAGGLVRYECETRVWQELARAGLEVGARAILHIPPAALMPLDQGASAWQLAREV